MTYKIDTTHKSIKNMYKNINSFIVIYKKI